MLYDQVPEISFFKEIFIFCKYYENENISSQIYRKYLIYGYSYVIKSAKWKIIKFPASWFFNDLYIVTIFVHYQESLVVKSRVLLARKASAHASAPANMRYSLIICFYLKIFLFSLRRFFLFSD